MNKIKYFMLWLFMFLWGMTAIAAPSPWDSWRSGYTNFEKGEIIKYIVEYY